MLRVCYSETADGQRWRLCGRLTGPWVDELRSCWLQARKRAPLARALVDLQEVTFIDPAGEQLLGEMAREGAVLVATGVANKYLIASLRAAGNSPQGRREDLSEAHGENATPKGGVQ
jgi:hypothetical protein